MNTYMRSETHYFIDLFHTLLFHNCKTTVLRKLIRTYSCHINPLYQPFQPYILPPTPLWCCDPTWVMASSFLRFLDHTQ